MNDHIKITRLSIFILIAVFILAGCTTDPTYQINVPPQHDIEKFKIGVVNWPADLNDPLEEISEMLKKCLKMQISELCQNIEIIGHQTVRDAVFPYMEPNTQPVSEGKLTDLLAQNKIASRLNNLGISILVTFSGNTDVKELYNNLILTHAGVYGFAMLYENTNIVINIWQINNLANMTSINTNEDGYSLIVGIGFLPIPFYANTLDSGCVKTSELIKSHITSSQYNMECQIE